MAQTPASSQGLNFDWAILTFIMFQSIDAGTSTSAIISCFLQPLKRDAGI